jgi:hypothetical protein
MVVQTAARSGAVQARYWGCLRMLRFCIYAWHGYCIWCSPSSRLHMRLRLLPVDRCIMSLRIVAGRCTHCSDGRK